MQFHELTRSYGDEIKRRQGMARPNSFANKVAKMGRGIDNACRGGVVGHMSSGDVVVPAKLIAAGHRCERCGALAGPGPLERLHVHHTAAAYHQIPHEPLETLRVLCWRCHRIEHFLLLDESAELAGRLEWLDRHGAGE